MKMPWLVTKVILWRRRRRTYGTIRLSRCAAGRPPTLVVALGEANIAIFDAAISARRRILCILVFHFYLIIDHKIHWSLIIIDHFIQSQDEIWFKISNSSKNYFVDFKCINQLNWHYNFRLKNRSPWFWHLSTFATSRPMSRSPPPRTESYSETSFMMSQVRLLD